MSLFIKDKSFYNRFFTLTAIIAMQNIIVFSVNLADNVMLGNFNETALSGVALANQIQFILQMLVMGVGEGIVILSSRHWGKNEIDGVQKIASIGMRLGIFIGLLAFVLIFFWGRACLSLFTNEQLVITEGMKYLKIICFSYLFFAMTNVLLACLRSVETVKVGFYVSLSTLLVNVCLNWVLIYGNFGFPRLGIRGAAIATLTARILEFVLVCLYLTFVDKKLHLRLATFLKIDKVFLKFYTKVSLPVIISNLMWGVAMAVQTSILGHMGGTSIAANSIATTVFQILSVMAYGSASASAVMIGKAIGEGDFDRVKAYSKTMQVLYLCIGIVTGVGIFFAKDAIIQLYNISDQTRELALQFMTILSIAVVGTSYQMAVLTGIVRGGGDTKFVLYNDTIFMWLIVLPSAYICAFVLNLSPVVVFCCLKSDQILKCFVAVVKVNRYKWIKTLEMKKEDRT